MLKAMKPLFAVLLEKALPVSEDELKIKSAECGINKVSTLRAYRAGTRKPPDEKAREMAVKLFETEEQREEFLNAIADASAKVSTRAMPSGPLKVSTLEFSAISRLLPQKDGKLPRPSGTRGRLKAPSSLELKQGFLDAIFLRFLRLSGREWISLQRDFSGDVIEDLQEKKISIVLSYFASIHRALHVHFWPLPIRLTIGALYRSEAGEYDRTDEFTKISPEIRKGLMYTTSLNPVKNLRPIVLLDSAAYMHCKFTLGYDDSEMEAVRKRDFQTYDEAYQRARERAPKKQPVIVDDELNLAEILAESDRHAERPVYIPALPLTSPQTARDDLFKRESPIYFISLACSRDDESLWHFLDEGMRILLLSEVFTTSEAYVKLFFELLETLKRARLQYRDKDGKLLPAGHADIFAEAYQWAMHTLHLTSFAISQFTEAYPHWRSILQRARERILFTLAQDRNSNLDPKYQVPEYQKDYRTEILQFVQKRREVATVTDAIRNIERDLDLNLGLTARALRYAEVRPDGLSNMVLQTLEGAAGDLTLHVDVRRYPGPTEMQPAVVDAVKTYLREYRESGFDKFDENESKRSRPLEEAIESPNRFLNESPGSYCLVATWTPSSTLPDPLRRILGIAFLVPIPDTTDMELRFLWVGLRYRGMRVGNQLITEAAAVAKKGEVRRIIVRVPWDAEEFLLKYFRDNRFERDRNDDQVKYKRMVRMVDR